MASEYLAFLLTSFPGLETETNPKKPRRGAYNISIHLSSGESVEVWDGKSQGPPRKLKFPDKEEVLTSIQTELSKIQ